MTNKKPKETCGFMVMTPNLLHNGGMWCAEDYPCKTHGKWKDREIKSTTTTGAYIAPKKEKCNHDHLC